MCNYGNILSLYQIRIELFHAVASSRSDRAQINLNTIKSNLVIKKVNNYLHFCSLNNISIPVIFIQIFMHKININLSVSSQKLDHTCKALLNKGDYNHE